MKTTLHIKYIIMYFLMQTSSLFAKNYYIDADVMGFPKTEFLQKTIHHHNDFFVFTHGKPGQLLINGQWLSDKALQEWLLQNYRGRAIRIYGCEFGKGEKGSNAVSYLSQTLGVRVSASNNITGINGDWELEVGNRYSAFALKQFEGNLQCSNIKATDDCDGDGIPNGIDFDSDNDGILDTDEGCYDSYAPRDSVLITNTSNATRISYSFGTTGPPIVTTLSANNNINMTRLMTTPSSSISSMSAGSGLTMVNPLSASLEISNVAATTYAQAVTNNEYITFSFVTNNIYNTANVDYVGFLNRIDQGAFSVTYSISADSGATFTQLASFAEALNDGGGVFPDGVENGLTIPYQIYPNIRYQVRIYFYSFPSATATIDFDDVYLAFDVCNLDTDKDGIPDYLDRDSDNDGCPDAIEGDENVISDSLNVNTSINTSITGGINSNGVPNLVNAGHTADVGGDVAQGIGSSRANVITKITASPSNQVAVENNTATFTVTATADSVTVFNAVSPNTTVSVSSRIIYQWQQSSNNGATWTNISGATSSSYTTPATTLSMDKNKYHVIISHIGNTCSLTSLDATLNITGILPITLIDFKVYNINNDAVLRWTTGVEKNNSHFEIERSVDNSAFSKIGTVAGVGNTAIEQHYEYTDEKIGAEHTIVYYRLKQVDFDGMSEYSGVNAVTFNKNNESLKILANPVSNTITFNEIVNGTAIIYNIYGVPVLEKKLNEDNLYINELPKGIYIIHIIDKDGTEILLHRFIKAE